MISKEHMHQINLRYSTQEAMSNVTFHRGHMLRVADAIRHFLGVPPAVIPIDIHLLHIHFSLVVGSNALARGGTQASAPAWAPRSGLLAVDVANASSTSIPVASLNSDPDVQAALSMVEICSDEILAVREAVIEHSIALGYGPSDVDEHHLALPMEFAFRPGIPKCTNPSCPPRVKTC